MIVHFLRSRPRLVTAIALGILLGTAADGRSAETGGGIGVLDCHSVSDSGINLIIHSAVAIKCVFEAADGSVEHYKGETGIGFGIDLDFSHEETFHFVVISAKLKPGSHHLAGNYAGGKASASLGVGGGAKILVGGDNGSIGLKPAAVRGTGVGIEAGLTYLHLEPDEQP